MMILPIILFLVCGQLVKSASASVGWQNSEGREKSETFKNADIFRGKLTKSRGVVTLEQYFFHTKAMNSSTKIQTQHAVVEKIKLTTTSPGIITTYVGTGISGFSGDAGAASDAQLFSPYGVAVDSSGNLYIADTYNYRIRFVSKSNGSISTFAGTGTSGSGGDGSAATSATLALPNAVALDANGNLYIADTGNNRIRKVDASTSIIMTYAGLGTPGFSGDGGSATMAELSSPNGVAVDTNGNVYVADTGNYRVRLISSTSLISTFAGSGTPGSSGDGGYATLAQLSSPYGVAVDTIGNLYISDSGSGLIRKVAIGKPIISTFAGSGTLVANGVAATSTMLIYPTGVAVDTSGNIYISEGEYNRIRFVNANTSIITTFAGSGAYGTSGDGSYATAAELSSPYGLTIDISSNLYIADTGNNKIRVVTSSIVNVAPTAALTAAPTAAPIATGGGIITTYAGSGTPGFSGDTGAATGAQLASPIGVVLDSSGNLYIADTSNNRIRLVLKSRGSINTYAGNGTLAFSGDGGAATLATLAYPFGVALDASGNLYIADMDNNRIRRVDAGKALISTYAGLGTLGSSGDGGPATLAELSSPYGVAVDSSSNIYIADTNNHRIRLITATTGTITTFVGTGFPGLSGDGSMATAAQIYSPFGVAVDSNGYLYIADTGNSLIRRVYIAQPIISTYAGSGRSSVDGVAATLSMIIYPTGITTDASGNVYISEGEFSRVRLVTASTGIITTYAGSSTGVTGTTGIALASDGDGGYATMAQLTNPTGLAVDASYNLYIAETGMNRIRVVTSAVVDSVAPTPEPTASPSQLVTQSPTIDTTKQRVSSIYVYPAAQEASVYVSIDTYTVTLPGTLYCLVTSSGVTPKSIDEVKATTFRTWYSPSSSSPTSAQATETSMTSAQLSITGLAALHSYSMYCYAEASSGTGVTIADVIAKESKFNTTCCIQVQFTNAPTSFYGDTSIYTKASSPQSMYVFSYALDAAPRTGNITVTPVLTRATANSKDTTADTVVVTPSSFVFKSTATSSQLTGSFIVTASSSTGRYTLGFRITGSDSSAFTGATKTVTILSPNDPLPAPSLKSCIFDNSGGSMVILFDAPTDLAGLAGTWTCNNLFSFTGSNTTQCLWLNSSAVTVSFSSTTSITSARRALRARFGATAISGALVKPGDSVSIIPYKLRAACWSNTNCEANQLLNVTQSVTAQRPLVPLYPVVVLTMPSVISNCSDLTIDLSASTGSGGRSWSSVTFETGVVALNNYLTSNYDSTVGYIKVPRYLLTKSVTVTVTMTNFFSYSASQTATSTISDDANLPVVTIQGASRVSQKAVTALYLSGAAQLTSCGSSSTLKYTWTLKDSNGNTVQGLSSTSLDPTKYTLPAYSLVAGTTYIVQLTVYVMKGTQQVSSASDDVSVYITHGNIVASILGVSATQSPVDQILTLDASVSYDEDAKGSSSLTYAWSCLIASTDGFGSTCSFSSQLSSSSKLKLPANVMTEGTEYTFTVTVSSSDGRTASTSALITAGPPSSPILSSARSGIKFNADSKMSIYAFVYYGSAVTASWSAAYGTDTGSVDISSALTPLSTSFTATQAASTIAYPIVFPANTFYAGRQYKFRLTASSLTDPTKTSRMDILLTANAPPSCGALNVDPSSGIALDTVFQLWMYGWTDDPSDLPLSYDFSYRVAQANTVPLMAISALSLQSHVSTLLPTGLEGNSYQVIVVSRVVDTYSAANTVSEKVTVNTNTAFSANSTLEYLKSTLNTSLPSLNIDATIQTINVVSSFISAVNCSAAPNCVSLNRVACLNTTNTCGSCKKGFNGIVGDSNTPCVNASTTVLGSTGASCSKNGDCLYYNCQSGVCTAPSKTCPTSNPGTVCSGHGSCTYIDASGNTLSSCSITQSRCYAKCACYTGYGGSDCSYSGSDLEGRSSIRLNICSALQDIIRLQNKSPGLFDRVASALLSAYDDGDIRTVAGKANCSNVLAFLGTMASEGYLSGTLPATAQFYSEILSQFVTSTSTAKSLAETTSARKSLDTNVEGAVVGLTKGILSTMLPGQRVETIVTDNIRVALSYSIINATTLSVYTPPATAAEQAYGTRYPSISVPGGSFSSRGFDNGYAKVSTLQFGLNPHDSVASTKSSSVLSPLMQFSTTTVTTATKSSTSARRRGLIEETEVERVLLSVSPAFYLTLQFNSPIYFNITRVLSGKRSANYTIPACSIYQSGKYVSCRGCNITSLTPYNVTYGCTDLSLIFPPKTTDDPTADSSSLELPSDSSSSEGAGNEVAYNTPSSALDEFAALMVAAGEEIAMVLSTNPLSIDLNKALAAVVLATCIAGIILLGFVVFISLDVVERANARANLQREYKLQVLRDLVRQDIRFGGSGIVDKKRLQEEISKPVYTGQSSTPAAAHPKASEAANAAASAADPAAAVAVPGNQPPTEAIVLHNNAEGFDTVATIGNGENGKDDVLICKRTQHKEEDEGSIRDFETVVLVAEYATEVIADETCKIAETFDTEREETRSRIRGGGLMNPLDAFSRLLTKHIFFAVWFGPTFRFNRTLLWLDFCKMFLLNLFVDTLFFGVFFPTNGACDPYETRSTCEATMSRVIKGQTLCTWSPSEKVCYPSEPPTSATFVIIVSLVTLVFSAPIDIVLSLVVEYCCRKRPQVEKWGWNKRELQAPKSSLSQAFEINRLMKGGVEGEHYIPHSVEDALNGDSSDRSSGSDEIPVHSTEIDEYPGRRRSENHEQQQQQYQQIESHSVHTARSAIEEETSTPEEEAAALIREVREYSARVLAETEVSTARGGIAGNIDDQRSVLAIRSQLKLNPDGSFMPLNCMQVSQFKTREKWLQWRLEDAHHKAKQIEQELEEAEVVHESVKDVLLMRYFVLEQLNQSHRLTMQDRFEAVGAVGLYVESIDPTAWLFGWIFIALVLCFFVYWILMWSVVNSGEALNQWGAAYGSALAQSIIVIECLKILIIFVFVIFSTRPQLQVIRRVIMDLALTLFQEGPDGAHTETVQVVQHLSPACRAAHLRGLRRLGGAAVLRNVRDIDILECRSFRGYFLSSALAMIVISVVSVAAMTNNVLTADGIIEQVVTGALSGFLIANAELNNISSLILIISYGMIFIIAASYIIGFTVARKQYLKSRRAAQELAGFNQRREVERAETPRNGAGGTGAGGAGAAASGSGVQQMQLEVVNTWKSLQLHSTNLARRTYHSPSFVKAIKHRSLDLEWRIKNRINKKDLGDAFQDSANANANADKIEQRSTKLDGEGSTVTGTGAVTGGAGGITGAPTSTSVSVIPSEIANMIRNEDSDEDPMLERSRYLQEQLYNPEALSDTATDDASRVQANVPAAQAFTRYKRPNLGLTSKARRPHSQSQSQSDSSVDPEEAKQQDSPSYQSTIRAKHGNSNGNSNGSESNGDSESASISTSTQQQHHQQQLRELEELDLGGDDQV